MLLRVGTRGSKLSLVQTDMVIEELRHARPFLEFEKQVITTKGDEDRLTPLYHLGEKGIFEKEINQAVLEGRVDFAVHSLKDLPGFDPGKELVLAGLLERGPSADVLVSRGRKPLEKLKPGSTVGTSSLLRASQLKRVRADLRPEPIRGNVETRIRKVESGEFDATILAEAGVARLGMTDWIAERLSIEDFIPAPGQGTIATVAREDNSTVVESLRTIDDPRTRAEAEAERELVRVLEGGCKVPIGALATVRGDMVELTAYILSVDGKERLQTRKTGQLKDAVPVGREAGNDLLAQGAKNLELGWRKIYA